MKDREIPSTDKTYPASSLLTGSSRARSKRTSDDLPLPSHDQPPSLVMKDTHFRRCGENKPSCPTTDADSLAWSYGHINSSKRVVLARFAVQMPYISFELRGCTADPSLTRISPRLPGLGWLLWKATWGRGDRRLGRRTPSQSE